MNSKIIQRLRQIGGILLILVGCVGMWGKYVLPAIAILLTGVSLLPSAYAVAMLKRKIWKWIFPCIGLALITATIVLIPPKQKAVPEFAGRDDLPVFVYVTKSGERYHRKQSCAGKSPRRTRLEYVIDGEMEPCKRCFDN